MRIIFILLALISLQLTAQDENKAALTAGSEFLKNNETSKSITTSETVMINEPAYRNEVPALSSVKSEYGNSKSNTLHPLIYILVFIILAIALYFIKTKNKTQLNTTLPLENEEDGQRKKQLWEAMAEPETE